MDTGERLEEHAGHKQLKTSNGESLETLITSEDRVLPPQSVFIISEDRNIPHAPHPSLQVCNVATYEPLGHFHVEAETLVDGVGFPPDAGFELEQLRLVRYEAVLKIGPSISKHPLMQHLNSALTSDSRFKPSV